MDAAAQAKVKEEISRYHNQLVDQFKSSGLPVKPGKTGVTDVAAGVAGTAWRKMKTIGLCNIAFGAYAIMTSGI
jgi:hypothetical protein